MGMSYERWQHFAQREPLKIGNFSEEISLLRFDSIENGRIIGSLEGEEARIIVGENQIESIFPGEFSFSIEEILPLLKTIPAPEAAQFVASKNGKYIYPLDSPEAALISVQNRIFFQTIEEAYEKGFQRRK